MTCLRMLTYLAVFIVGGLVGCFFMAMMQIARDERFWRNNTIKGRE